MERDLDHIIGQYLTGSISEEDRSWLEAQMQADPELRAFVQAARRSFLVEDYAQGKLSEEEKEKFEKRLTEDPKLQKELHSFRQTQHLLDLDRHGRQTEWLKEKEDSPDSPEQDNGNTKYWLILAPLAIAITAALYFLLPENGTITTPSGNREAPAGVTNSADLPDPTNSDSITATNPADSSAAEEFPQATGVPPVVPEEPSPTPAEDQPTIPNEELDTLRQKIRPIAEAGYMDEIRQRDLSFLTVAGNRNWRNLIVNQEYLEARQVLEAFFRENEQNYANYPRQAYYLAVLYLYTEPVNAGAAADILEAASPNLDRYRRSMSEAVESTPLDRLRAYLLSNTPEHREKARALLQKNPELMDQL